MAYANPFPVIQGCSLKAAPGESAELDTFPARRKGEVLHPGRKDGEDLVLQLGGPGGPTALQLPRHQLHTQRLAKLRVVPGAPKQALPN
jgi:hypothetical protein